MEIDGFKRFTSEQFEFGSLNVLTGLNGSGKTSFIQALLLVQEASTCQSASLRLNGPFGMELGAAEDVLNWDSAGPIRIRLESTEGPPSEWKFEVPSEDAMYLRVAEKPPNPPRALSGAPRKFIYLSAERIGPRSVAQTSPLPENEIEVGRNGEYCAHVLSVLGGNILEDRDRSHPLYDGEPARLIKYEVEHWLSEIARPIEVNGERLKGSTAAELKYRAPGSTWVRSTNMGFGVTYALPIILAGITSNAGSLMIIENPEAHLHPAGQSRMGVFLAWLAGKGVQVVVETHSDHILNGVRRAVAEYSYLDAESALIHWFGGFEDESDDFKPQSLKIGYAGAISNWPRGFFDQYQIDVASLGRVRRKRT